MGAEGVFIAGCGEQCARENTASQMKRRVNKVQKVLSSIGIEPERIRLFVPGVTEDGETTDSNDVFEQISGFYLESLIRQEGRD